MARERSLTYAPSHRFTHARLDCHNQTLLSPHQVPPAPHAQSVFSAHSRIGPMPSAAPDQGPRMQGGSDDRSASYMHALLLCSRVALASYVKGYRAAPDQGLRSGC